jgi:hypothetical protein
MIPTTFVINKEWGISENIPMADETFDQLGQIDLLLGTEVFFNILRSGRQTRPGDYCVLRETVLG